MYLDIVELMAFYDQPMGQTVRRLLAHRLRARWRDVRGMTVAGLGYPAPYLGTFRSEADRVIALMPAQQGGTDWPAATPCRSVLVMDEHLPLPDLSVDRMLLVHSLESSEAPRPMLREVWRVLKPEGRMLAIVPNRRGLWARRDNTPFGNGNPFSRSQIEKTLIASMFAIEDCSFALAIPPLNWRWMWDSAPALERWGMAAPSFAGVILVEARKEIGGVLPRGHGARLRVPSRQTVVSPTGSRRIVITAGSTKTPPVSQTGS